MKKIIIIIFVLIIVIIIRLVFFAPLENDNGKPINNNKPAKQTFVMIHMEAGYQASKNNDFPTSLSIPEEYRLKPLGWQEYFWPTLKDLVKEANKYDFKLTIAFNPQWAEYILQDNTKIVEIKNWQKNGHEIAFHHHHKQHPDWNGYTNSKDSINNPLYLGSVNDGFSYVNELAKPESVISSTMGGLPDDFPSLMSELSNGLLVFGSGNQLDSYQVNGKIKSLKPVKRSIPNLGIIVELTIRELSNVMNITINEAAPLLKKQYLDINEEEVFGIVFHEFDYFLKKDSYIDFFNFIKEQEGKIETMSVIAKRYIDK